MTSGDAEDRAGRRAAVWLGLLTAARLGVAAFVGLGDSEAYYWTWAKHPDLSYYDHPPMIAWIIGATTAMGGDAPLFVRLGPILLCAATAWMLYGLAVELSGSRRAGLYALVLFQLVPAFSIGGQGANPDVPLGLFWVCFLRLLWRMTARDAPALAWPAGLALGLALLSKYFAVLLPVVALLWLFRREHRRLLARPSTWGGLALGLACFAPVIVWNVDHDWPSLRYHLGRHGAAGWSLEQAGVFFGGQALYYSPLLWPGLLYALWRAARLGFASGPWEVRRPWAFLATAALVPLVAFTAIGLWTPEAEPHWTAMGYVPLCVAGALLFHERRGRRPVRIYAWVAGGASASLIVLVHVHLLSPIFVPLVPERDRPRDLASETVGWPEVGRRALALAMRLDRPVLLHYHYTKCAQLAHAVRRRVPVACLNDRTDQFDFWQDEASFRGRSALYVTDSVYSRRPEEVWRFDRCEEEAPLEVRRGPHPVRRFRFWRCEGYRGPAPGRRDL